MTPGRQATAFIIKMDSEVAIAEDVQPEHAGGNGVLGQAMKELAKMTLSRRT